MKGKKTMTLEYTSGMLEMAHEILAAGAKPYTDEQLKEIPRIINTIAITHIIPMIAVTGI